MENSNQLIHFMFTNNRLLFGNETIQEDYLLRSFGVYDSLGMRASFRVMSQMYKGHSTN